MEIMDQRLNKLLSLQVSVHTIQFPKVEFAYVCKIREKERESERGPPSPKGFFHSSEKKRDYVQIV